MSIRKKQEKISDIYFCTFTCHEWLQLFKITDLYDFIFQWFDLLKQKGIKIIAYVIMPNHIHFIVSLPENSKRIDKIIGNGKRFMAYEIVKRLKDANSDEILLKLRTGVSEKEQLKNKQHNVFIPSFDAKQIFTKEFMVQKINYIHTNPVRGKWNLIEDYRYYQYSSAGFYELENYSGYEVIHYSDIWE